MRLLLFIGSLLGFIFAIGLSVSGLPFAALVCGAIGVLLYFQAFRPTDGPSDQRKFRFEIRGLLFLTLVVGVALAWLLNYSHLASWMSSTFREYPK